MKLAVVLLLAAAPLLLHAQPKKGAIKSGKSYARLVKSVSQRTLRGVRGMEPVMQYHFITVWKNDDVPLCFFWRAANGWASCLISKAHKLPGKHTAADVFPYTAERISTENIQKGDTLELTPITGGKFPIPADIPANAHNTLYFKTANTGWLSLPVKKISRQPDVIMP